MLSTDAILSYGRKTFSLMLREEHKVRVFEKRVLRRIFGPKRDKGIEDWRELTLRLWEPPTKQFYSEC
jgi:hypothetical protein